MSDAQIDTRPPLNDEDVKLLLNDQFDITQQLVAEINKLPGYDDLNFHVKVRQDNREYILKITNWKDSENVQFIDEMTNFMAELSEHLCCSTPSRTRSGKYLGSYYYNEGEETRHCIVRLFNFMPGSIIECGTVTRDQAFQWGSLLGQMHKAVKSMSYPAIKKRSFLWSWEGVPQVIEYVGVIDDEQNRAHVLEILTKYKDEMIPKMKRMKRELLHGDLNERNVLINSANQVYAVIDFGDSQGGPFIWDVALVLAYLGLVVGDTENDLFDYFGHALAGYSEHMPDVIRQYGDVESLRILVCARFAQSLTLGLRNFAATGNSYVLTSQEKGWPSFKKFRTEPHENIVAIWQRVLSPYGISVQ